MLAMHIPDGFIDAPTSVVAAIVAIAGVAYCLNRTSDTLEDREIPVVGLTAAFVFALQMLNFPVANGTSGHLLGGVLAAVLVGPWAGALAVTVVLAVQALVFADGGLSALGLNVLNMSLVGAIAGYAIFALLRKSALFSKRADASAVGVAAGIAAAAAPVLAAVVFTVEYATGGNGAASVGTVLVSVVGVHILIGIGEGIITAMAVSAVMATRPDLVYGVTDDSISGARPLGQAGAGS